MFSLIKTNCFTHFSKTAALAFQAKIFQQGKFSTMAVFIPQVMCEFLNIYFFNPKVINVINTCKHPTL